MLNTHGTILTLLRMTDVIRRRVLETNLSVSILLPTHFNDTGNLRPRLNQGIRRIS